MCSKSAAAPAKRTAKTDCLVLDFAGNVRRFGPVDDPRITTKGGGNGEAPTKTCPECDEIVALAATECPGCGYEFPPQGEESRTRRKPTRAEILSSERTRSDWLEVEDVAVLQAHQANALAAGQLINAGIDTFNEWICFEHQGFARAQGRGVVARARGCTGVRRPSTRRWSARTRSPWPIAHSRRARWQVLAHRRAGGSTASIMTSTCDVDWRSQPKPEIDDAVPY